VAGCQERLKRELEKQKKESRREKIDD